MTAEMSLKSGNVPKIGIGRILKLNSEIESLFRAASRL